jgi:hypothetical protein
MERDYDLFEVNPDGSLTWRGVVHGHEAAVPARNARRTNKGKVPEVYGGCKAGRHSAMFIGDCNGG